MNKDKEPTIDTTPIITEESEQVEQLNVSEISLAVNGIAELYFRDKGRPEYTFIGRL